MDATWRLPDRPLRASTTRTLALGIVGVTIAAACARTPLGISALYPVKAAFVFAAVMTIAIGYLNDRHPFERFGTANQITTLRAALTSLVAALIGEASAPAWTTAVAATGFVVATLDGVDGWAARRTRMASVFGANFDMETDALFIMALSALAWQTDKAGPWILLAGLMRYLFLGAVSLFPWMRRQQAPSVRRKAVCVVQVIGLSLAMLPSVSPPASTWWCAVLLVLLLLTHSASIACGCGGTVAERTRSLIALGIALIVLDASVTFLNVWPTPAVRWTGQLSAELALLVCGLAAWHGVGRGLSAGVLRSLTVVWLLLVLSRYAFVTSPALWGRELNFYWDLQFLPDVFSMLAKAVSPRMVALVVAGVLVLCAVAYITVRWAIGRLNAALTIPVRRRTLAIGATAALLLFAAQRTLFPTNGIQPFATPVAEGYAHQVRFIVDATSGRKALPASPSFASDMSTLEGADVLLFFIESYGAVTYERPELAAQISNRRAILEAAIHDTGNDVASAFVTSPTFGGSSWFAHITLLSGLSVRDPDTNALLMTEHRDTLPVAMARHGYRSVALMPGLWSPWPEGAFYGFHEIYNARRFEYKGPPIGWWDLPDQYSFARLDQLERDKPGRAPLFVFFPTISTHTPFSPLAPYQPDWPRMLTNHPFDDADIARMWEHGIDWTNLGPAYAKSINYAYEILAGYLAKHRGEKFVMIVLGDHQPPALVSGEGAPWEVPVHVITNNAEVLDRLKASGFRAGLTPARPTLAPMDKLLPILLNAFGNPEAVNAN